MKKNYINVLSDLKFLLKLTVFCIISVVKAQIYFPFDAIPLNNGAFDASININVAQGTEEFNNLLLGSNVDFNTSIAIPPRKHAWL